MISSFSPLNLTLSFYLQTRCTSLYSLSFFLQLTSHTTTHKSPSPDLYLSPNFLFFLLKTRRISSIQILKATKLRNFVHRSWSPDVITNHKNLHHLIIVRRLSFTLSPLFIIFLSSSCRHVSQLWGATITKKERNSQIFTLSLIYHRYHHCNIVVPLVSYLGFLLCFLLDLSLSIHFVITDLL